MFARSEDKKREAEGIEEPSPSGEVDTAEDETVGAEEAGGQ